VGNKQQGSCNSYNIGNLFHSLFSVSNHISDFAQSIFLAEKAAGVNSDLNSNRYKHSCPADECSGIVLHLFFGDAQVSLLSFSISAHLHF